MGADTEEKRQQYPYFPAGESKDTASECSVVSNQKLTRKISAIKFGRHLLVGRLQILPDVAEALENVDLLTHSMGGFFWQLPLSNECQGRRFARPNKELLRRT